MIATQKNHKINYGWNKIKVEENSFDNVLFDILLGYSEDVPNFFRLLDEFQLKKPCGPLEHLSLLRRLLCILLVFNDSLHDDMNREKIRLFSQKILVIPYWKEFQLIDLYVHFCKFLLKEKDTHQFELIQNENGSVLLDFGCHFSWAGVVQQPFLAELGVILSLYGYLLNDAMILDQAYLLAKWHTSLLDAEGIPLNGLFSQEKNGSSLLSIAWCYLFFNSIGSFLDKNELLFIAKEQKKFIDEKVNLFPDCLPLIYAVLESVIEKKVLSGNFYHVSTEKNNLDPFIFDFDHFLVGIRTKKMTAVSTTLGGRTGLGTLMINQYLGVVTFGPQLLPFDDCNGFGIENPCWKKQKFCSGIIERKESSYFIKGFSKLPSKDFNQKNYSTYGNSFHNENWIDITQTFKDSKLNIDIVFLGFKREIYSFTFYVKASFCKINDFVVNSKSLEKYNGKTSSIKCFDKEKTFSINPLFDHGTMEIIPLVGGNDFWSGDFLVGFFLDEAYCKYQWSLQIENL